MGRQRKGREGTRHLGKTIGEAGKEREIAWPPNPYPHLEDEKKGGGGGTESRGHTSRQGATAASSEVEGQSWAKIEGQLSKRARMSAKERRNVSPNLRELCGGKGEEYEGGVGRGGGNAFCQSWAGRDVRNSVLGQRKLRKQTAAQRFASLLSCFRPSSKASSKEHSAIWAEHEAQNFSSCRTSTNQIFACLGANLQAINGPIKGEV